VCLCNERTADGDKTRVRVTVSGQELHFDLEIGLKTSNEDIAVAEARERLVELFESVTKELREQGLRLESKYAACRLGRGIVSGEHPCQSFDSSTSRSIRPR
jgi:hypothetical protein